MADVLFKSGTYAQYVGLTTKNDNTIYFIDNGQIYKGETSYTDQIVVVSALPSTLVAGKVYVNTTDKSVTYYDGATSTVVIPETVGTIGDATPGTDLANVKAIKDFVAAEIAKIPAQTDYTVIVDDSKTVVNGQKKIYTIKQGKTGSEVAVEKDIVIPDLKIEKLTTPTTGSVNTYEFTYGDNTAVKIEVPDFKDKVVSSGEVIVVDDTHPISGLTNGTYLKLVIANDDANPVYINTNSLVDVYTGKTATDGVSVAISDTNEISATLVGKAVTESNLEDTLAKKIADADAALTWGTIS